MAKLTRRELLKTTGAAAVAIAACGPASELFSGTSTAQAAATGVWNHNPAVANRTPSLGQHRVPGLRPGHESVSCRHQDQQRGHLSWLSTIAEV